MSTEEYKNLCEEKLRKIAKISARLRERNPLIHCITSPIAVNDCANAVLAAGARPIMAEHPEEAAGITAIAQALGVSLANITDARASSMMLSGQKAREMGIPSVIDVVGVNCSPLRMKLAEQFLKECSPAVIKGNASEIRAIAGAPYGEAGIDTAASDQVSHDHPGSIQKMAEIVRRFSRECGAVVLASGVVDLVSDGKVVYALENGSALLAKITGTGCILNCLVASYLSVGSPAEAVLYAVGLLGIAGECAEEAERIGMKTEKPDRLRRNESRLPGLGSFHMYLMDAISTLDGPRFLSRVKIMETLI